MMIICAHVGGKSDKIKGDKKLNTMYNLPQQLYA
jgi:hypothetical protein